MPRLTGATTADSLAEAARTDPHLGVPARPALRPGMHWEFGERAVTVDTGTRQLQLSGPRISAALAALTARLDGTSDHDLLATLCGLAPSAVEKLLGVLAVHGLLQEGPSVPDPRTDGGSWLYLSRGVAATGVHADASGALDVLESTPVWGVDSDLLTAARTVADAAWVIVGGTPDRAVWRDHLRAGRTVVPVVRAADAVTIGPVLEPGNRRPCLSCVAEALPADDDGGTASALADVLVAMEVAQTVGRFGRTLTNVTAVRHDLRAWRTDLVPVACRGHGSTVDQVIRDYEAAAGLPARRWLDPALHRGHYRPGALAAQTAFPRAPGPGRPALDPIGAALRRAVGLRATAPPDRYAPSAGNLGIIIGYAADANGIHQYDPYAHEWVTLEKTGPPIDDTVVDGTAIVLAADIGRSLPKYGLKAYRLAWLEAGAAMGQLAIAATAQGLRMAALTEWPDAGWEERLGPGFLVCAMAVVS
ncbi:nitroreductase family protein [Hamadaea tsunoensis]|uniref:nitroreductase family protein n=1 Tax=Hamadaea tsunoensis TaxID=53368 RepID=UPI00041D48FC|nr:nitroreductase family protein [Hamadaea tsunoensis]